MPERNPYSVVHDPQILRAIAHPVRNRILHELSAQGSLRAADVARELDIPANQASFHLRQLAKYGLVEEDPAAAHDKRDRVWKATDASRMTINLKDLESTPGGKAASAVFRRNAASWGHVVVERVYSDADEARRPDTHSSLTEMALRLTKAEAGELAQELSDLVDGWAERTRGNDPARSTYLYFGALLPHPGTQGEG